MIILDTNIISEMMKLLPSPQVITWIDSQIADQLFITTLSISEIMYGIHALPQGKRRKFLSKAFEAVILEAFQHRLLSFDEKAAYLYGQIMAHRKQLGRPLSILDGQIAAITASKKASLATRNTSDFLNCGLTLINPFN